MSCLEVDGASIWYERKGAGRPVYVLVHGGCCTHTDWRWQVEALGATATVLAIDLRAHGQSTGNVADCTVERWAKDINALVDALELGPAVLVGHSLASRIVAETAWQRPDNVAALVLLDGSRSTGSFAASDPRSSVVVPPPVDGSIADILNATVGPYADDAIRRYVIETMSAHSMELMVQTVSAYGAWDRKRADVVFAGLGPDLPVLAIQSTYHDPFTPRHSLQNARQSTPYLDWLKSVRPGLEIVILPETGHFSMLERPEHVTALIRVFAQRQLSRD